MFAAIISCSSSTLKRSQNKSAMEFLERAEGLSISRRPNDRQDAAALIEEGAYLFSDYPNSNTRIELTLARLKSDSNPVVRKMSRIAESAVLHARKSRIVR